MISDSRDDGVADLASEAQSLYDKLEHAILPLYYSRHDACAEIRRSAVSLNGSFFHTQRMVLQHVRNAYLGVEPQRLLRNKLVDHCTFKTGDEARTAIFAYVERPTIVSTDISRWISFVHWNIKA